MISAHRTHLVPLAAALLAVSCCGCNETEQSLVEASVFLPDGYYRESRVADDIMIRCKMPYTCRNSAAIGFCKKDAATWESGPGYCGGTGMTCGRCLYPDLLVVDSGAAPDLPPPQDKGAPDVSHPNAPQQAGDL